MTPPPSQFQGMNDHDLLISIHGTVTSIKEEVDSMKSLPVRVAKLEDRSDRSTAWGKMWATVAATALVGAIVSFFRGGNQL